MKSFSWTLALRYLNPLRNFVSVITLISLLGVAFGVMVLIVVLSVHNGFEQHVKDTLLGHSPHLSAFSRYGNLDNWEEMEDRLANEKGVKSAYALVEGFALLDSRKWQRPVYFRAFNTENEGQIEALRSLLDPDYPGSSVDFNPPLDDSLAAPPLPPPLEEGGDLDPNELPELPPIDGGEIYGDRLAVISSQLAEAIEVKPGDEIRVVSANNFDELMEVYNYPEERAWDLYSDIFVNFEEELGANFKVTDSEEQIASDQLMQLLPPLGNLLPREVETPDGPVFLEGEAMRPVERRLLGGVLQLLEEPVRREGGSDSFEPGTLDQVKDGLKQLRDLDLQEVDHENFKELEEFVVPKTLKVQGVYKVSERTQGPDIFVPIGIGMELKGISSAEFVGLRVEDPYEAGKYEIEVQESLGPEWVVQSWMKRHVDRFQLLKTEKLMMSFALSFITLLSAFSIMAVMYTVTIQKRQEIGVMKALGARPSQIVLVFVYQGLVVGVGGSILGLVLGLLAIHYREVIVSIIRWFGMDPFPAQFHGMSGLPAQVVQSQLLVISLVAVVLCLLAAMVPALMAAFRDPARSLRNL